MIYYGNGGFNFTDLYTMPIYLRNFYLRKMMDIKKKEKEADNPQTRSNESTKKIHRPDIRRASKK